MTIESRQICSWHAYPDISDSECDADNLLLMPIIISQIDLQAEFPDLDSGDSEGEETGKDITDTDIESQNQEAKAAADDVLPVQIEHSFNKLSTLIVYSLTPVFLSFCIHLFIPNIKVLTIWREVVRCSLHTPEFFSISVMKISKFSQYLDTIIVYGYSSNNIWGGSIRWIYRK